VIFVNFVISRRSSSLEQIKSGLGPPIQVRMVTRSFFVTRDPGLGSQRLGLFNRL
jgi:hypothetical protein